jgi:hypothetical protein
MAENSTCFSPTLKIDERRVSNVQEAKSARESVTSTSRQLLRYAGFLEGNMRMPYDGDEGGSENSQYHAHEPNSVSSDPTSAGRCFF